MWKFSYGADATFPQPLPTSLAHTLNQISVLSGPLKMENNVTVKNQLFLEVQEHRKIEISAGLQYVTHSSGPNIIGSRMQNDRPPPAAAHEKEQNFEGSVACACSPSYPRPCPGRAESRSPSSPLHSMSDTSSFTIPSHIIT